LPADHFGFYTFLGYSFSDRLICYTGAFCKFGNRQIVVNVSHAFIIDPWLL